MAATSHSNLRKLNQLPYHLIKAGQLDKLKNQVVCNYEFLLAKMKSSGLGSVLSDLKAAQMVFNDDSDIFVVLETLQVWFKFNIQCILLMIEYLRLVFAT